MERIATFKDFVGELTVNYRRTTLPTKAIKSSADAAEFMRPHYLQIIDDHEELKLFHLNRKNNVVNIDHSTTGTDTACLADVKDIVRNALMIKTHGVILFHNHPSGNLNPSKADIDLSNKLRTALGYFDIPLLDSIILTREGFYSLADNADF